MKTCESLERIQGVKLVCLRLALVIRTVEEGFISMPRRFPLPCSCNLRSLVIFSKT
jgi:hypothetical protein